MNSFALGLASRTAGARAVVTRSAALVVAALVAGVVASPASAVAPYETVISAGGPLKRIAVGNELSCQVHRSTSGEGEVYDQDAPLGDCGTLLAYGGTLYKPDFQGSGPARSQVNAALFTPVAQSPVGGSGTTASPFTITTSVATGGALSLSETDSYVEGHDYFRGDVTVSNSSGSPVTAQLYRGMDCYLDGSDQGYSSYNAATGAIGCSKLQNDPASQLQELVPNSPHATTYIAARYSNVWSAIQTQATLPNTVVSGVSDNGAALGWTLAVPANGSITVSYLHRFTATTPINDVAPQTAGLPYVGHRLTSNDGTWRFALPVKTYQWQRCATSTAASCVNIAGATSASYSVTSADDGSFLRSVVTGESTDGTTATAASVPVGARPAPALPDVASVGPADAPQRVTVVVPAGEQLRLVDGASLVTSVTRTGEGTYTLNTATDEITFTPVSGYRGLPAPVTLQLTDGNGNARRTSYAPSVGIPPTVAPGDSTGSSGATQSFLIPIPTGGTAWLLDGTTQVTSLMVPGEGAYSLERSTGVVTFAPHAGFAGRTSGVRYRVLDAAGQSSESTYTPTVTPVATSPVTAAPAACVSKRLFRIHFKIVGRARIRRLTLTVNGQPKVLRRDARSALIDLRQRPEQTVSVAVVAERSRAKTVRTKRTYRTCAKRRPPAKGLRTLRLH